MVQPTRAAAISERRSTDETGQLARCGPEEVGVDAAALLSGIDTLAGRFDLHSIMVAKAGRVICEKWWWPAGPARPHGLHSATKSFVATAVGLAVAEGVLRLDTRIVDVLNHHLPAQVSERLARVTVADLLTMRGGNAAGISGATTRKSVDSLIRAFLAEPVVHEPGTVFTYSSASSHLLSAVVQQASGDKVSAYLRPRLFEPVGLGLPAWDEDREGICTGGNGLRTTTESLLRFGLLHLADGVWNGQRVLPEGWVAQASHPHVRDAHAGVWDGERLVKPTSGEDTERSGYGYQFWVDPDGSYSAQGVFGQICLVDPASDCVVVTTAGIDSRKNGFNDAIRHDVLSVLREPGRGRPRVDQETWQLEAARPPADRPGRHSEQQGIVDGRFVAEPNDQGVHAVTVTTSAEGVVVAVDHERGEQAIYSPWSGWAESRTSMYGEDLHHSYQFTDEPVVAHARWAGPTEIELSWWFPETAFRDTVRLAFHGNRLAVDRSTNANSGSLSLPTLVAHHGDRLTSDLHT